MPRYLEVTLFSALYFVACSPRPTPATAPDGHPGTTQPDRDRAAPSREQTLSDVDAGADLRGPA